MRRGQSLAKLMKLMAVFIVEFSEETDEMHLLTYRVKKVDIVLVKTTLFFQNLYAPSHLNFSEFFETSLRFFSLEFILPIIASGKQYLR